MPEPASQAPTATRTVMNHEDLKGAHSRAEYLLQAGTADEKWPDRAMYFALILANDVFCLLREVLTSRQYLVTIAQDNVDLRKKLIDMERKGRK